MAEWGVSKVDKSRKTAAHINIPIEPVKDGNGCLICGNQDYGCGVVGRYDVDTEEVTEKYSDYCLFCGRKVKWE